MERDVLYAIMVLSVVSIDHYCTYSSSFHALTKKVYVLIHIHVFTDTLEYVFVVYIG